MDSDLRIDVTQELIDHLTEKYALQYGKGDADSDSVLSRYWRGYGANEVIGYLKQQLDIQRNTPVRETLGVTIIDNT